MPGSEDVFTGTWINYDRGKFLGPRYTVESQSAAIWLAFLAIVITYTGNRVWVMVCFCIYHFRHHEQPRQVFERQQDILLRTTTTSAGMIWRLGDHVWRWRSTNSIRKSTTTAFLIGAILHFGFFLLAGIWSGWAIGASDNHVIGNSSTCGIWIPKGTDRVMRGAWSAEAHLNSSWAADSYAQNCYGQSTSSSSSCQMLSSREIPWHLVHNVSCPFGNLCLEGTNAAFEMDTGDLDIHYLGINVNFPMTFRRKTTCSLLRQDGYYSTIIGNPDAEQYTTYGVFKYGHRPDSLGNETHAFNLFAPTEQRGYTLDIYAGSPNKYFIEPLLHEDGFTTLLFMGGSGVFATHIIDDVMFASHNKSIFQGPQATYYEPDQKATATACVDKHRVCYPDDSCSVWFDQTDSRKVLGIKKGIQTEYASRLIANGLPTIHGAIAGRGGEILRASRTVFAKIQAGNLAREQWKIEVSHLFEIGLAGMQLSIFGVPSKPDYLDYSNLQNSIVPTKEFCRMVKYRSAQHTSLSLVPLVLILSMCALLIGLSYTENWVGALLWKRWPLRVLAWRLDWPLQMQRLANEGLGLGGWRHGFVDTVPIGEGKLGVPILVDDGYARLGIAGGLDPSPIKFKQLKNYRHDGSNYRSNASNSSGTVETAGQSPETTERVVSKLGWRNVTLR